MILMLYDQNFSNYGYDQFINASAVRIINSYHAEGLGLAEEVYYPIHEDEYVNPTFATSAERNTVRDTEDGEYQIVNDNIIHPESMNYDSWYGEGVAAV